jgi:hypothetical protein
MKSRPISPAVLAVLETSVGPQTILIASDPAQTPDTAGDWTRG